MIELLNIFFLTLIICLFFKLPLYKIFLPKNLTIETLDKSNQVLNLLIFSNIILFLSFFNINLVTIIYVIAIFAVLTIIFNKKKINFHKESIHDFLVIFFLVFFVLINISYLPLLSFDAKKIWLSKAQIFINNGSIHELNNTGYPYYPYFGSLVWAFFSKISSLEQEYIGRIFSIYLFCLSILYLGKKLKFNLIYQYYFSTIVFLLTFNTDLFTGLQEVIIFSLLIFVCCFFYEIFYNKKNILINLISIILSLNLLIWTKNEGILITILISVLIFINFYNKSKKYLFFILPILLLLIVRVFVFKFYNLEITLSKDFDFYHIFSKFFNNLKSDNIIFFLNYFLIGIFKYPIIPVCVFFSILILYNNNYDISFYLILLYLFTSIFLIFFIYFSTNHFQIMIITGLHRLLFEFSGFYLLLPIIYLNKYVKNI